MNPFDWRGPQFLLFFAGLVVAALASLELHRRRSEGGPAPAIDLADPYLLAYLRGGEREPLIVAIVSLLDRGLLAAKGTRLRWNQIGAEQFVRRPLERALLSVFKTEKEITEAFSNLDCQRASHDYATRLARAGALPDDDIRAARRTRLLIVGGILLAVAVTKIVIGMSRDAPVGFLIVMTIVALILAAIAYNPPRTARGDRLLADIRLLFNGLRDRAQGLHRGHGDTDVTMLAAVFGVAALPSSQFPFVKQLFPRAKAADSSGSSTCGSSCGSSCGGGGGGCGGCGGGGGD